MPNSAFSELHNEGIWWSREKYKTWMPSGGCVRGEWHESTLGWGHRHHRSGRGCTQLNAHLQFVAKKDPDHFAEDEIATMVSSFLFLVIKKVFRGCWQIHSISLSFRSSFFKSILLINCSLVYRKKKSFYCGCQLQSWKCVEAEQLLSTEWRRKA